MLDFEQLDLRLQNFQLLEIDLIDYEEAWGKINFHDRKRYTVDKCNQETKQL